MLFPVYSQIWDSHILMFLKFVWKWWGWEWLLDRLDGCATGALHEGKRQYTAHHHSEGSGLWGPPQAEETDISDGAEKLICFPF